MKIKYILDACALITLFNGEAGDDIVDYLLEQAEKDEICLVMHIAQLLEVYYDRIYVAGIEEAKTIIASNLAGPIEITQDISYPVFYEAGRLKTAYSVSFADSIVLATASVLSVPLVTSDHKEFESVKANEDILFYWLPAHPKKNR
jgi:predicted nucleic acid-binding protein